MSQFSLHLLIVAFRNGIEIHDNDAYREKEGRNKARHQANAPYGCF